MDSTKSTQEHTPLACEWCEEKKEDVKLRRDCHKQLCDECYDIYDEGYNRTGYCSFDCIMTGQCDSTC
jgi:hypothetical protein